ncbi:MAG: hypothetical protein HQL31_05015 [Planctomycetes bacterium]|nr:hypothetical protein [Planctomycetota bacterium]
MKRQIQEQLMREYEGLSLIEHRQRMEEGVMRDPILGPWYAKAKDQTRKRSPASGTLSSDQPGFRLTPE